MVLYYTLLLLRNYMPVWVLLYDCISREKSHLVAYDPGSTCTQKSVDTIESQYTLSK